MIRPLSAFTLIELLVVITIIVVLLALLTPALDKAIYQTELTVCAANMRGIASGALNYAASNQRRYPWKLGGVPDSGFEPFKMRDGDKDLRTVWAGYISNKTFQDPLLPGEVDYDTSLEPNPGNIHSPYNLWYGFQFKGYSPMFKLGDRFSYDTITDNPDVPSKVQKFGLLLDDNDMVDHLEGQDTMASHPDKDGAMSGWVRDGESAQGDEGGDVSVALNAIPLVIARWLDTNRPDHGEMDRNFAYSDNSVRRINDVISLPQRVAPPGFALVPYWASGPDGGRDGSTSLLGNFWCQLPVN